MAEQRIQNENQGAASEAPVVLVQNSRVADDVQEIDLIEVFFTLLNGWKSLFLGVLIGAVILAAYHTFLIVPTYQATTELYITSNDSVISLQDLQVGSALTEDYRFIITSRAVLNQVIDDLKLDVSYEGLKRMVTVTNPSGTHVIRTSVTTRDLALSRDIANDLLNVSIERIYQVVGTNEPTIIDFSEAEAVQEVTPRLLRYVAIGGMIGFLLVAAVLIIRMLMNNTIRTDEDVEKYLELPVLSAIPFYHE